MVFTLPPETNDRTITVTIPKELDPYFKEWYLATKRDTDTPEDFAFRELANAGIQWRRSKRIRESRAIIQTDNDEIEIITTNADL